jgi:hypothetical protein
MLEVSVSDAAVAQRRGYIYAAYPLSFSALYIGQTRGAGGAIGRLAQHLGEGAGNTLRLRLCDVFRYDEVEIGPVSFAAVPLVENAAFHAERVIHTS